MLKIASEIVSKVAKSKYIAPKIMVKDAELFGKKMSNLVTDSISFKRTPLAEFENYMQGVAKEGNNYKPVLDNLESPFVRYYNYIQEVNLSNESIKPITKGCGGLMFTIKKPTPHEITFNDFRNYLYKNADFLNISKDEYFEIINETAKKVKENVLQNPNGLRKEFVDNADRIQKWAEIFSLQSYDKVAHKDIFHKFYDKEIYDNAVREYTEFVEQITGKKVLIGCKSRMNFPISALGLLNDPKAYKDVDYILLGHGKNSSLITDINNPLTWRFSDNDKSIWEFIEAKVPKGKKVLVFCCETDGLAKAGKTREEMVDLAGKRMFGIGDSVSGAFYRSNPAKICESGIRHIKGHCYTKPSPVTEIGNAAGNDAFRLHPVSNSETIYYDLDYSKFKV
ncbi:MAG: hypothetical protein MJ231_01600 [bacterium]|nr:hypothetical protein [bacterium]